jgi:hypothetical protein
MMDFQGAKLSQDTGFILMRELDQRHNVIAPMAEVLEDNRSATHAKHTLEQMIRQRVYQMTGGYEDCNDADYLRVDPAMRLSLGKGKKYAAGQSALSRLENDILGNVPGLSALDEAVLRAADALIRRKDKYRFILDVDSTEDPAHGKQEGCEYNGHFGKNCFHPIVAFTGEGDCLAAELRPGNVHSADGVLDFIKPIVKRYREGFTLFWLRSDAAFAQPDVYEYCEREHLTYFIRLPMNDTLKKIMEPELKSRPVGRPPKSGVKVQHIEFYYRAGSWKKRRRVVCKIEWHNDELFPRVGFIVTNSTHPAWKVVKVYNGRANVENRIKEAKNTLRWDKTSCHRFEANQARLKMGAVAYNLLHMVREFHLKSEEVKRSIEWIIRRIIKAASRISYHGRRWWVHVASAFPLAHHYRAVLGTG